TLTVAAGTNNSWVINGADDFTLDIGNGPVQFTNFANIVGDSLTDTGTLSGNIDGGGGTNTLKGDNVANTWNINGVNSGTVTGLGGTFTNIQNLTGNANNDTFNFKGGSVSGTVDGGTAGTNTLDYSGNGGNPVSIVLTGTGPNVGFQGTATSTGGFKNIDVLVGSTGSDSLTGQSAAGTWTLNGDPETYTSGNTLT